MNPTIVVTGFGPFIGHEEVNASWEAVRLLPDSLKSDQKINYTIEKKCISVDYDDVNSAVDGIWAKKPALVVHCGVHGGTKCIRVEELAYNHKFNRKDYSGKKLVGGSACLANNGTACCEIRTKLDVKKIVEKTAPLCGCNEPMVTSDDVGNYLCGYIYLKSLDKNSSRSLFVHVPPIDKPFSSADTSDMILKIIAECIRQIEELEEECQQEDEFCDAECDQFCDIQTSDSA
ncbi:pyroglutamyl-peptidase 1 isoform X2 [Eupeodes corollae]|nr:pyroglutamyl-peptidase 1 isoform X2 [Eupeodes corollae]XP_055917460.1 pyroglutamyl-peptidase 1 isoform X2 [Eupeodes corollae]XP_055917461.1 pyroglutamyl-peptidase 1 isoform X2 [Eupeodes corollae]XP_055917462.1 pyroglutamyl-peptidase 1 isoform X2 [Eupeodes corollae]